MSPYNIPPLDIELYAKIFLFYIALTLAILVGLICGIGIKEILIGVSRRIKITISVLGFSVILAALSYAELKGLIDVL